MESDNINADNINCFDDLMDIFIEEVWEYNKSQMIIINQSKLELCVEIYKNWKGAKWKEIEEIIDYYRHLNKKRGLFNF